MPNLSSATQKLIQRYQNWYRSLELGEGITTLHVDEVVSAMAKFYEKIRGIIDWREEHLLRKSAIERILNRRLLMEEDISHMAEPLILELIRGGHLPNDTIPESKIEFVQRSINKYVFLINSIDSTSQEITLEPQDWLFGIAACEIEEILLPPAKENALIDYMTERMTERIETVGLPKDISKETQIFIACQQALFKLDNPLISYHLLKRWYPDWLSLETDSPKLQEISKDIYNIRSAIEYGFSNPIAQRFYTLCEKYDTPYLLLGDILAKDPLKADELLANPEALEGQIREVYVKRLYQLRAKVRHAAIFSTLSIFITKVLLALLVEIPVDKYLTGGFNPTATAINIVFPPLLMAFLVLSIRPPSEENLQGNILEIMRLVYETSQKISYTIRMPRKQNAIVSLFIYIFYLLSFIVSFGFIIKVLTKLQFSILSQIIFLMFISLISFAGLKLRQRSKELVIKEDKRGVFFTGLLVFFAMPIVRTGKWLSGKLTKYNIIMVFINAFIEMPLQIFFEFMEQMMSFLREKKEEIH